MCFVLGSAFGSEDCVWRFVLLIINAEFDYISESLFFDPASRGLSDFESPIA
jgi:hypothetical protein